MFLSHHGGFEGGGGGHGGQPEAFTAKLRAVRETVRSPSTGAPSRPGTGISAHGARRGPEDDWNWIGVPGSPW